MEWRVIEEFPAYMVSDEGDVFSVKRKRLLKPRMNNNGYLRVNLNGKERQVSRLILEAFVGPCPPGHVCCHWNDKPTDNRLSNLRWGTYKENYKDSVRNRRCASTREAVQKERKSRERREKALPVKEIIYRQKESRKAVRDFLTQRRRELREWRERVG